MTYPNWNAAYPDSVKPVPSSSSGQTDALEQHTYTRIPVTSMITINSHFTKCRNAKADYYKCIYK